MTLFRGIRKFNSKLLNLFGVDRIINSLYSNMLITKTNLRLFSLFNRKTKKKEKELKAKEEQAKKKEKEEYCRKMCFDQMNEEGREERDFEQLGGQIYSTCGSAYVLQKENKIPKLPLQSDTSIMEKKILDNLETPPEHKNWKDPMPPFENVGQRLLDLSEKKLHPLYKKYMSISPKPPKLENKVVPHKFASTEDTSSKLKINKEFLDKKNIYADFKRLDPPRRI